MTFDIVKINKEKKIQNKGSFQDYAREMQNHALKTQSLEWAAQVCSGGDGMYDIVPVAKEIYNFLQEISDDKS